MRPDGIPVVVWKCMREEGVDILSDLLQKIYEQKKIPIFKEKGDIHEWSIITVALS